MPEPASAAPDAAAAVAVPPAKWAKVVDHQRCIGCHACTTACKSENEVPVGVTRTYVKYVDVGVFPQARRAFQVTRCNQCDLAPCTDACPTRAMFRRPDGIVDFDKSICIGCKACMAACPYDAIFINPEDHSAEKCNFCAHRLDAGLEPACVVVCPTEAILVGDLNDPDSRVAQIVNREPVAVRRPEKGTLPKLFYRGAHQATLDPLAARRPPGGLFMWSQQGGGGKAGAQVTSGHPGAANSSAAALLAYDVPHAAPWDWRVSLYTLTKGIAAGVYLVALLLLAPGFTNAQVNRFTNPVPMTWVVIWCMGVPLLGGLSLVVTGGLLIWDLEHPRRFFLIFTRPQWRSWLVRGGFLIAGYGVVLALHVVATFTFHHSEWALMLAWLGAPLALATAVYTAYLFAQAKARDLWQNPLLPPHFAVQAVLAGAAALLPLAELGDEAFTPVLGMTPSDLMSPPMLPHLLLIVAVASLLHLALVLGECTLTHGTAHAQLAVREMTRGRFRGWFWAGIVLSAAGAAAPWIGAWAAAPVLAGLFAFEHAYVQAGQSVPLA
jgi:Fe-S-cluster-containing dehydrogenase component/formate-dependent nitrite reductase membrane component NrfD